MTGTCAHDEHNVAVWATNTAGSPGAHLAIQDDGNMVIYHNQRARWATNTG